MTQKNNKKPLRIFYSFKCLIGTNLVVSHQIKPELVFTSQGGNWSALGPWKTQVWPHPWCSGPTWPCPVTAKPWLPCLTYQAFMSYKSPNKCSTSLKTSNQRWCTLAMTAPRLMLPIFCSPVSTGCVRNSWCGLWSGQNLSQVTAFCISGPSQLLSWGSSGRPCWKSKVLNAKIEDFVMPWILSPSQVFDRKF